MFEVLVLGFNGIEGFSILGALLKLESLNYLEDIKCFSATSTASIIAFLLVLNYKISEIKNIVLKDNILFGIQDIRDINDFDYISKYLEILRELLNKKVEDKYGVKKMNMKQLYESTGVELSFITTKIIDNTNKEVIINHETYPYLDSVEAVLSSCNLSLLSGIIKYDGYIYHDGYVLNPYPINIYKNKGKIIGLYSKRKYVESDNNAHDLILDIVKVFSSCVFTMKKEIVKNSDKQKCLNLPITVPNLKNINYTNKYKLYLDGFYKCQNLIEYLKK